MMNDDTMTELIIKITSELSSLNANMKSVLDKLSSHEQRISALEQNKIGIKDTVIQWLVKGLIASIMIIGSLTGASALIKEVIKL
ncbi:MAG: hypothetical protein IIZ78_05355 [Clostridiales bacterium]|nr:hypothetical protein [Clostridiales bacterium]MBQ1570533.1 hypothetical protein [Clostridiales bacterium]